MSEIERLVYSGLTREERVAEAVRMVGLEGCGFVYVHTFSALPVQQLYLWMAKDHPLFNGRWVFDEGATASSIAACIRTDTFRALQEVHPVSEWLNRNPAAIQGATQWREAVLERLWKAGPQRVTVEEEDDE